MEADLVGLQKQMEELTILVKKGNDDANPPKWWEAQENRITAMETRMTTNQGYVEKLLKILTGRDGEQEQSEGDQVNTPDNSKNGEKNPILVTVVKDKSRFTYKTDELGILKDKPDACLALKNGKVEKWFDGYIMQKHHVTWHEFEADLCHRFSDRSFSDIVEEFTKLTQKGSVEDYQERFEELQPHMLLQNPTLGEEFFVSLFISGLREDIKHRVKALDPKHLSEACKQAKLYELSVEFENRKLRHSFKVPPYPNPIITSKTTSVPLPTKSTPNSNPKQSLIDYRRQNNLCFKRGEKFQPDHQCKTRNFNMMIEEENPIPTESVPTDSDQRGKLGNFYECNYWCISHNTLRIQGTIQGRPLNILIDSGSTHSFLTPQWADAGIQVLTPYPLAITVANGVDWMKVFSLILMDFNQMTMSFQHQGENIIIQGQQPSLFLQQISSATLLKMTASDEAILGHVVLLSIMETPKPIPTTLQPLLKRYNTIFTEPKGLPPRRAHDHAIPLKLGSSPINLRPYKFPHNQKTEVEQQIAVMLSSSIIQPRKSPFASPCLLSKKKDDTWRFCVDYRQLNNLTVKDKFPIPVVEDILDELYGAVYFSKIDLRSGYWQIRIKEGDIYKTTFRTHQGHYEFKTQVEYLGHIISADGVTTDPSKIEAMKNWPLPRSLKSLRGFFGLTGYYRRFIKDYGSITLPDFSKSFCLETDASSGGIGAVLSQEGRPIAYLSKALSPRHAALFIYESEYLAILLAVSKWRHYLERLTKLLGLDYSIQYRKGKSNTVADALSRQWEDASYCLAMGTTFLIPSWVQDVENSYKEDKLVADWINILTVSPNADPNWKFSKGILRFKGRVYIGSNGSLRLQILQVLHDSPHGGHSGTQATYQRIRSYFYWPKLKAMVVTYIRCCTVCQQIKVENISKPGLLQPLPIPHHACEVITMDFIEGLPTSLRKNYILVIVDKFTKYSHFMAFSHPYTAAEVAKLYLDNINKLHGKPKMAISDRDKTFTSLFWRELMKQLGTTTLFSTTYHLETDGQTERVNQYLEQYLRGLCFLQPKQWAKWLAYAKWWYNTTYHTALNLTHFQALYGYKPPTMVWQPEATVHSVGEFMKNREEIRQLVKHQLEQATNRMKQQADKNRTERIQLGIRIGEVAYKLELPENSRLHPVFHVSMLKRHIGPAASSSTEPPVVDEEGQFHIEPSQVLGKRIINRNNRPVTQLLVRWTNLDASHDTWEDYSVLRGQFPSFDPWGQGSSRGVGIVMVGGERREHKEGKRELGEMRRGLGIENEGLGILAREGNKDNLPLEQIGRSRLDMKQLERPKGIKIAEPNMKMLSVLLKAALCNVRVVRPTLYHVIKEMIEMMGYSVKLVRVTKRVHGAYFAQLYLTKMSQEGDETESITFDLRPSDAINIAVRCKVPIQVNKYLAYSDGMRVIEPGKLSMQPPASDILPHTELDQPSGQRCLDSEEFKIVSDLNEAISQERYKDAADLRDKLDKFRAARNSRKDT
ncbi:Bifunctional nuclease 2 [Hibiscus syriacus]|uniref:Bifunctional nuclease 2 n=1 Tax=Hibiscus syriacus TaxID=106335 RepID=A0A6A2YAX7_HIBSY|nr:Bifunctional nuclease 2 [Hibiscus syriacus]